MYYPVLTIKHNHGFVKLSGVTVDSQGVAHGTVIEGCTTNKLFHCCSTYHIEKGVSYSYPLYGRVIREDYLRGMQKGVCMETPVPGSYNVDVTFC